MISEKREFKAAKQSELGMFEVWITASWKRHTVYYSGHEQQRRNGVAFMVNKDVNETVIGCSSVNDWLMSIRFHAQPFTVTFIQVYYPTTDTSEEEIEKSFMMELRLKLTRPSNKISCWWSETGMPKSEIRTREIQWDNTALETGTKPKNN